MDNLFAYFDAINREDFSYVDRMSDEDVKENISFCGAYVDAWVRRQQ